ncbi:MAG: shikimate dehydrogenase family protein [Spirochaetaceae bacterium]
MTPENLQHPEQPTFYFVGVTTGYSSIMRVFPRWVEHLDLGGTPIVGIDCKIHDEPEVYRRVTQFIKEEPNALGALVTTHKIDLLQAARDLFDELDENAELLGEVSCISKRDGRLRGHALDPITSGLSLQAFLPEDHFERTGADLCLLGAGGSSLALTTYVLTEISENRRPKRLYVTNRSLLRLESMKEIHRSLEPSVPVEYAHAPAPEQNDAVVGGLADGSLVANATGLGKDAPGSPVTDEVQFPRGAYVWDFNYRGDLLFLEQARRQQETRQLVVEDGWRYFVHGWIAAMSEVFHVEIPRSGPEFDKLSEIAARARKEG